MANPAEIDAIKDRMCQEVDRRARTLVDASHEILAHSELGFEETFAHELLTAVADADGLEPERSAYGHNIIATAGLGAALAAAAVADELGGRLLVLGTPAEEGGGGKQLLADAGAFEGVDAAMMVHPAGLDLSGMHTLAVRQVFADYEGLAAHASAAPHAGRNALDAAVLGYVNIAALRQHIRPTERIHGIFTRAGDRPNIVPAEAQAHWFIRSDNIRTLEALSERVDACLQAGADAAGCRLTRPEEAPRYAEAIH